MTALHPKILLVDDNPRILRSLNANLKTHFEIVTANNGQEALDLLKQPNNGIQAVLTDEKMPKVRGHEVLTWLKDNQPKTIRGLITGNATDDLIALLDTKVEQYFSFNKPWNSEQIISTFKQAIENNKKQPEKKQISQEPPENKKQEKTSQKLNLATLLPDISDSSIYSQVCTYLQLEANLFDNKIELLDFIQEHLVPVLIIDAEIGNQQVLTVIDKVKTISPKTKIIALTNIENSQSLDVIKLTNNKVIFDYIIKPFTINRMLPKIIKILSEHRHKDKASQEKSLLNKIHKIWK